MSPKDSPEARSFGAHADRALDTGEAAAAPLTVADLVEINDRFHDSALLHFANRSGLFEQLRTPQDAARLAAANGWLPRKAQVMLDAMVALGLLEIEGGRYRNAPAVARSLLRDAELSLAPVVEYQHRQWDLWNRIGEVLSSEEAIPAQQEISLRDDPGTNREYNTAMRNLSVGNIARFLDLGLVREGDRVLDLGGGHGAYATELARTLPGVTGEIWDLDTVAEIARETIDGHGVADRVTFRTQDIADLSVYRDQKADVVLLNNVLHYFDPDTARAIVRTAAGTLRPGGRLAITAVRLEDDRRTPSAAARFSFYMVLNAAGGQLHATDWLAETLRDCGMAVEEVPFGSLGIMPTTVLIGRPA